MVQIWEIDFSTYDSFRASGNIREALAKAEKYATKCVKEFPDDSEKYRITKIQLDSEAEE